MSQTTCLNCGNNLNEPENFCSACGQKTATHRLNLHEITHDTIHAVTHADKGFFYTVKELAFRPGYVAREYIEGKRKKYFNPFSFLVIVTGILVLVSSNFKIFGNAMANAERPSENNTPPKVSARIEASQKRSVRFVEFMNNHSNIVPFISTPFLAFFFWMFYKKKKLFYAEHLTSMAFFNSFLMIITSVVFGSLIYFTRHMNIYFIWLILMLISHVFYLAFAYKQLLSYKGLVGFLKTLGISIVGTVCWMIFSLSIGMAYVIWGP